MGIRFDNRIQFMRAGVVDTGMRDRAGPLANLGDPVWASKQDISDGERSRAGTVSNLAVSRFMVRWSSFAASIKKSDALKCGEVTYQITGIKDGAGRRRLVEITVSDSGVAK
jgi:hypothetical protein